MAIVDPALEQGRSEIIGSSGDLDVVGDIGALMVADLDMDVGPGFGAKVIIQQFIHA